MSAVAVDAVVTGREDGPVVVLSNSLGSTYKMWNPQVAALEERFRVVRYNIRGHGGSPVLDGPYSIDDLADDLVALLDRLGIGRAHLVGLSLGGMTAMRVAARDAERVDRLAAAVHRRPMAARLRLDRPRHDGAVRRQRRCCQRGGRTVVHSEVPVAHPEVRQAAEAMVTATPAQGYAACCEAIAALDLRDELASITAPTLAIAGADDPATPPPKLEEIATGVKNGKLLVVARAAHLANAEQPGIITPALIEHLEKS